MRWKAKVTFPLHNNLIEFCHENVWENDINKNRKQTTSYRVPRTCAGTRYILHSKWNGTWIRGTFILAFQCDTLPLSPIPSSISLRAANKKSNKVFNMTQKSISILSFTPISFLFPSLQLWQFSICLKVFPFSELNARDRYGYFQATKEHRMKTKNDAGRKKRSLGMEGVGRNRSQNIIWCDWVGMECKAVSTHFPFFPSFDSASPLSLLLFHLGAVRRKRRIKIVSIEIQS